MVTPTIPKHHKTRGRKPATPPIGLAARLKEIRRHVGVSQEAVGAQGFVSAPGWIKIENGQRQASEKLLAAFVNWLVHEKLLRAANRAALLEELSSLKYAYHRSPFLAKLGKEHLAGLTPVAL